MANRTITVAIEVNLRADTLEKFSENVKDVPVSEALGSICSQFLENRADGAVVIKTEQISKIEQVTKKSVANAQDIVDAALRSGGVEDGANVIKVQIDPTWMQPLEDRAKECGRSVSDLMSDLHQMALEGNWVYGLDASYVPPVYFPNYELLREITGKERPTGAQIEEAIKELRRASRRKPAIRQVEVEEPEAIEVGK